MFEISRFRALALVLASVLAALAALDLATSATVGSLARFLPHDEVPTDRRAIETVGGRLAAVVADRRGAAVSEPLGVLLGQSTLMNGVDPLVLDEHDGMPVRWVNLAGVGGSIHRINDLVDLLDFSGLKPEFAVVAINPFFLAGTPYAVGHDVRRRAAGPLKTAIKEASWLLDNRTLANYLTRLADDRARMALFRRFGLGGDVLFRPDPARYLAHPLATSIYFTAEQMRTRLEYDRAIGWFDPRRYTPEAGDAVALVRLIRHLRDSGARTCLVLMPEHSTFRAQSPPEARRCLDDLLDRDFRDDPVPVIDLEDKLPDTAFFDLDHLDPGGRAECSRMLGERLREQFAGAADRDIVTPARNPSR